jgi:hypothetical protein
VYDQAEEEELRMGLNPFDILCIVLLVTAAYTWLLIKKVQGKSWPE